MVVEATSPRVAPGQLSRPRRGETLDEQRLEAEKSVELHAGDD